MNGAEEFGIDKFRIKFGVDMDLLPSVANRGVHKFPCFGVSSLSFLFSSVTLLLAKEIMLALLFLANGVPINIIEASVLMAAKAIGALFSSAINQQIKQVFIDYLSVVSYRYLQLIFRDLKGEKSIRTVLTCRAPCRFLSF